MGLPHILQMAKNSLRKQTKNHDISQSLYMYCVFLTSFANSQQSFDQFNDNIVSKLEYFNRQNAVVLLQNSEKKIFFVTIFQNKNFPFQIFPISAFTTLLPFLVSLPIFYMVLVIGEFKDIPATLS